MAGTDDNNKGRRWMTSNQDEYRNPAETKIDRYIQSEEMARYMDCKNKSTKAADEELARQLARQEICCKIQNEMREPTYIPNDWHINPKVKHKPAWCRCLATGPPGSSEEAQIERETDALCECKKLYNQMEATAENSRQRIYSSTYFLDFRSPDYPYIETRIAQQAEMDKKFKEYKAKRDAEDEIKAAKSLPPLCPHIEPDDQGWREAIDDCRKYNMKQYWTTTYREMNLDGAALPLTKRTLPVSSKERNANPILAAELADRAAALILAEKCKCPEFLEPMAGRCDTMYNRPDLEHDSYFQEHRLCRAKFARDPQVHTPASRENMSLVKKEKLRLVYDRPIPGYAGYDCIVAPPVCKIKKNMDPTDPYEIISSYQANFIFHPVEIYSSPVQMIKPEEFINANHPNPINPFSKIPLPCARRLTCSCECPDECDCKPKKNICEVALAN